MIFSKIKRLVVQNQEIRVKQIDGQDYICISDMVNLKDGDFFVSDWLRNRNTLEFLSVWESIYNTSFNYGEFAIIKNSSGLNNFKISVKQWVEKTNAKGLVSSPGRYGGTYAHKDIALEFGSWISAPFKLYLIKEYQRLKEIENNPLNLEWDVRRILTKTNLVLQTDAIKEHLIPNISWNKKYAYTDEADLLNLVLFGVTAKQWRTENPTRVKLGENIRDSASINELIILTNLESYNAELIKSKVVKQQRFELLQKMAKSQGESLKNSDPMKSIKKLSKSTYLELSKGEGI